VRPAPDLRPGVRANFLQLIRLVERGIPLPFARVNNLRSFVNVGNLCDLMVRLIEERDTARGIYHVADAEDCSTAELIREIAVLMGKPARLFACPNGCCELEWRSSDAAWSTSDSWFSAIGHIGY